MIPKEDAEEHIRKSVDKLIDSGQFDSAKNAAAWYAAGCPDFLMDDAVSEDHPKASCVLYIIYTLVDMNLMSFFFIGGRRGFSVACLWWRDYR